MPVYSCSRLILTLDKPKLRVSCTSEWKIVGATHSADLSSVAVPVSSCRWTRAQIASTPESAAGVRSARNIWSFHLKMQVAQVEQAIKLVYEPCAHVQNSEQQQAAVRFLQQTLSNPSAVWPLAFQLLGSAQQQQITVFWALDALVHVARHDSFDALPDSDKTAIREAAMRYVKEAVAPQQMGALSSADKAMRNKLAQLFVWLLRRLYLTSWRSFWTDWLALAQASPSVADIFLRISLQFDQDLVSVAFVADVSRDIKDRMREDGVLESLVEAWLALALAGAQAGQEKVASKALRALARFVDWIDIALAVSPRVTPTLFAMARGDDVFASWG
ncbi:MAG: hypothetical protein MHM6MM_006613 [Cercozoa sp. M6MM]